MSDMADSIKAHHQPCERLLSFRVRRSAQMKPPMAVAIDLVADRDHQAIADYIAKAREPHAAFREFVEETLWAIDWLQAGGEVDWTSLESFGKRLLAQSSPDLE